GSTENARLERAAVGHPAAFPPGAVAGDVAVYRIQIMGAREVSSAEDHGPVLPGRRLDGDSRVIDGGVRHREELVATVNLSVQPVCLRTALVGQLSGDRVAAAVAQVQAAV